MTRSGLRMRLPVQKPDDQTELAAKAGEAEQLPDSIAGFVSGPHPPP